MENTPQITVRVTKPNEGFGHKRVYPVCEKAKLFATIAKSPCLGQDDSNDVLNSIRELGYVVKDEEGNVI